LREASFKVCLQTLLGGGVVALPTETVYGLACLALDKKAVQKVYEIKERPPTNPLIVHVLNVDEAEKIAYLNPTAKRLCHEFWPGPLTLILPKRQMIPDNVTAGLDTVAIRSPSHPLFRKILQETNQPLAAPSANLFSKVSSTTPQEVSDSFGGNCPPILDGGKCNIGLESTVLDLTTKVPTILRPGPISKDELAGVVGDNILSSSKTGDSSVAQKSPGLSAKHYSPETPIRLYQDIAAIQRINHWTEGDLIILPHEGLLADLNWEPASTISLSASGNAKEIARNLYATLKKADSRGKKLIHLALLEESSGLAGAVNDRLMRASSS
jgi:L-threonylcarbamoyladenylate synthase